MLYLFQNMTQQKNFDLSVILKNSSSLSNRTLIGYVWCLSIPGIFAQISSIIMQYIDAGMVGYLGAEASAAISLVASSTWVLGSLSGACSMGFTVQVAQAIGAGEREYARQIFWQSILFSLFFSIAVVLGAGSISQSLPAWLGAQESIREDAFWYFLIFVLSSPLYHTVYLMSGMLQASGNMKTPGILNGLMCLLDVFFNFIFIYIFRLGVKGAALGSAASALVIAATILYMTLHKSDYLNLHGFKTRGFDTKIISRAVRLSLPIACQRTAFTGALVAITKLIAPLGAVSLAANSFAVTAESLCYMPGYGIEEAATTLVGQSIGATRHDLARRFSRITVIAGVTVMSLMGLLMYFICPYVFKFLTPVQEVQALSIRILRLELFAEPFYAMAIVASGALHGSGDTFVPSLLNLFSLWIVRFILSIILVAKYALLGIWIAMAVELTFRGIVMVIRMNTSKYINGTGTLKK